MLQIPLPHHLCNGLTADQPNGIVCKAAAVSCHTAAGLPLLHQCHRNIQCCNLVCHDQPDVSASQYHHRPGRYDPMQVHHFLHLACSIDSLGSCPGNGQGPRRNLPAACCKDQAGKCQLPSSGQSGNFRFFHRQNGGIGDKCRLLRKGLQKAVRIFHPRPTGSKAWVAALEQHTAQSRFSVHNCDLTAPGAGRLCCGDPGRSAADDQNINPLHNPPPSGAGK